jgi:hypothetical protein
MSLIFIPYGFPIAASQARQAYRADRGKKKEEKPRRYATLHGKVPRKSPDTILYGT